MATIIIIILADCMCVLHSFSILISHDMRVLGQYIALVSAALDIANQG